MHHHAPRLALGLALLLVLSSAVSLATAPATAAADFPAYDSRYHTYAEMVAEINATRDAHPDIVAISSIGKSYQGRDLWVAKVSDNVATDESEPEVMLDSLHHAREHLSLEQNLAVLRWLTAGYGTTRASPSIVNTREIWIVFAVNPDGAEYDLTGSPTARGARTASRTRGRPRRDRPQPQLRLQLGVLRRIVLRRSRPRPITARGRSRRPSRGRSATSWPADGSAASSRSRPPSPSTPPASRSCGRTATPRRMSPPT